MGKKLPRLFGRLSRTFVAIVAAAVLVMLPILQPGLARAQENAQGLQVSPVIVDLNSEKGGTYTLKLTVTNVTASVLDVTSGVNDFTAADESGNPKIITDTSAPETSYSLRSWVNVPSNFSLSPKQSKNISVIVNVPKNAESGGHYGVIRFTGTPRQGGGQVSLNASVGTLLLARVAGNITEKLSVQAFYAQQKGKRTGLVSQGPVTIVSEIHNDGNVHVKPIGTLTVRDTFGKTVASYPFGGPNKNVLPGSTRKYEQEFDKKWMFGRYTAHLEAGYGTTGGVLIADTAFWVIPWKLILFLLVIITLAVFIGKRLLKRYNQRIIRKAQSTKTKNK